MRFPVPRNGGPNCSHLAPLAAKEIKMRPHPKKTISKLDGDGGGGLNVELADRGQGQGGVWATTRLVDRRRGPRIRGTLLPRTQQGSMLLIVCTY